MPLSGLNKLFQDLFIKHGHITLPMLFGILLLESGLGHMFFNPTTEVAIGTVELVGSAFLFLGALLAYRKRNTSAIACYAISVICIVITVVIQVGILFRQMRN